MRRAPSLGAAAGGAFPRHRRSPAPGCSTARRLRTPRTWPRAGFDWREVAENIAGGQRTPEEAVASWLESAPHCANLMSPAYTQTGVGYAPAGAGGPYWAQVFATPMG